MNVCVGMFIALNGKTLEIHCTYSLDRWVSTVAFAPRPESVWGFSKSCSSYLLLLHQSQSAVTAKG